jgi:hypothetical protein
VIHSFRSVEEMLAAIENDRIEADGSVKDWQSQLAPGDFFVRVGPGGVAIYCEVLDPSLPTSEGPHDDEYLEELKEAASWYSEPHMRNFRFCRAFSLYCEQGEMGDVHISTAAMKISKENFEAARSYKWKGGFHEDVR